MGSAGWCKLQSIMIVSFAVHLPHMVGDTTTIDSCHNIYYIHIIAIPEAHNIHVLWLLQEI